MPVLRLADQDRRVVVAPFVQALHRYGPAEWLWRAATYRRIPRSPR